MANQRNIGDSGPIAERQARDAQHPGDDDPNRRLPDIGISEQKAGYRAHEGERGAFAEPGDAKAFHVKKQRGERDDAADDDLSGQNSNGEPQRNRTIDDDGGDRHDEEDSIDSGIEDLAELAGLIELAGDEAIDPVGASEQSEQPSSPRPVVLSEQEVEEEGQTHQPQQREEVRQREDVVEDALDRLNRLGIECLRSAHAVMLREGCLSARLTRWQLCSR